MHSYERPTAMHRMYVLTRAPPHFTLATARAVRRIDRHRVANAFNA
jgi:hypothetical protein